MFGQHKRGQEATGRKGDSRSDFFHDADVFSQNLKATARQREPHKNKAIFKLLVNKMPVRRIIEVTDIDPHTFDNRLGFLHRQCQLFAARRERALANLPIRLLVPGRRPAGSTW